jgi:hypothetical protein
VAASFIVMLVTVNSVPARHSPRIHGGTGTLILKTDELDNVAGGLILEGTHASSSGSTGSNPVPPVNPQSGSSTIIWCYYGIRSPTGNIHPGCI